MRQIPIISFRTGIGMGKLSLINVCMVINLSLLCAGHVSSFNNFTVLNIVSNGPIHGFYWQLLERCLEHMGLSKEGKVRIEMDHVAREMVEISRSKSNSSKY